MSRRRKRPGRQPVLSSTGETRSERAIALCSPTELELLRDGAEADGKSLSSWLTELGLQRRREQRK